MLPVSAVAVSSCIAGCFDTSRTTLSKKGTSPRRDGTCRRTLPGNWCSMQATGIISAYSLARVEGLPFRIALRKLAVPGVGILREHQRPTLSSVPPSRRKQVGDQVGERMRDEP